jgi:hypothetical protein
MFRYTTRAIIREFLLLLSELFQMLRFKQTKNSQYGLAQILKFPIETQKLLKHNSKTLERLHSIGNFRALDGDFYNLL